MTSVRDDSGGGRSGKGGYEPPKDDRGRRGAGELRDDESRRIDWPDAGKRVTRRPSDGDGRIRKRGRGREPIRAHDVGAHGKRHDGRTKAGAPPNHRE